LAALLDGSSTSSTTVTVDHTPLMTAAVQQGHADMVRLLVERGAVAHVNHHNDHATAFAEALFDAAFRGHAEVVRVLLEQGPIYGAPPLSEESACLALLFAVSKRHASTVRVLLELGAPHLFAAVMEGGRIISRAMLWSNVEVTRVLLLAGAVPPSKDRWNRWVDRHVCVPVLMERIHVKRRHMQRLFVER
jgi:ankyrin repeat protein